jgi:hypothetical protein
MFLTEFCKNFLVYKKGPDSSVSLAATLRTGRSGDRLLVGGGQFPRPSTPALGPTTNRYHLIPGSDAVVAWR